MTSETTNYGIGQTIEAFEAADQLYELGKAFKEAGNSRFKTWPILLSKAPPAIDAVMKAVEDKEMIPKELTDLDEAEKAELYARFGDKIDDPRYQKIFIGLMEIADGITELVQGEEN